MHIICYSYEADYHCKACTHERFAGLPDDAKDSEGNPIHPVFETDETPASLPIGDGGYAIACGTCGDSIQDHYQEPSASKVRHA